MRTLSRTAAIALALTLAACADIDTGATTAPYAHETPPGPPALFQFLDRSGYLGGSGADVIDGVALGGDGTIYVVGGTASLDFPTTDGSALDASTPAGCSLCPFDAFVAAIAPDGAVRWTRLINSPGYDRLTSILVIGQRVFVAGSTGQRGALPGWHGGADPSGARGEQDGLVCALSQADGTVEACRYLGGNGAGGVTDLDRQGGSQVLAVTMVTAAGEDLHLDPAYSAAFAGRHRATAAGADVVVMSLTTSLTAADNLLWATYVGGSGDERGTPSVLFEADGSFGPAIYVLAETTSTDAPVPGGFQTTAPADGDSAYFAALRDDGTAIRYGSYVGGNGADRVSPHALVDIGFIDEDLSTYLAITTTSTDMPAVAGSPQAIHGGNGGPGCGDGDLWLARLRDATDTDQLELVATRYLGGSGGERLGAIKGSLISTGLGILVTGSTASTTFPVDHAVQPTLAGTPCATNPGNTDAFALELDEGLVVRGSTYLGGGAMDHGTAIVRRGVNGTTVVVGETASADFPRKEPADLTFAGARDAFITWYTVDGPPTPPVDAGLDAGPADDAWAPDASTGADGDGGGGCCGVGSSPAAPITVAFWVLGLLVLRRRRSSC